MAGLRYPCSVWGYSVTTSNRDLPFDVAGVNKDAVLKVGDYLAGVAAGTDELCAEVARAMNEAHPGQAYTCVYDHTTRKFTLDNGAATFKLEFTRNNTTNCANLLGFDKVDTADLSGHTSTSASGVGFSATGGVKIWTATEPIFNESPVVAAADGTAATFLQRAAKVAQNRADGGFHEPVWFSTDKLLRLEFKWLAATGAPSEITNMESFLDWIERGRRFNYYPDSGSANALRLALKNPGEVANVRPWMGRDEIDYPELLFVEQLSRV